RVGMFSECSGQAGDSRPSHLCARRIYAVASSCRVGHCLRHRRDHSLAARRRSGRDLHKVGESFFEAPGAIHLVSENASLTEPAELPAVFVADEGATLTTYIK